MPFCKLLLPLAIVATCGVACTYDEGGYQKPAGSQGGGIVLGLHHFKGSNAVATQGKLVLRNGCVTLKFKEDQGPLGRPAVPEMLAWPSDFTAEKTSRGFRVRDGQGRIVAESGDIVRLGGGPIDAGAIGTSDGGNLPSKCLTRHMFAVGRGMVHRL
jgi:hypothetical protein